MIKTPSVSHTENALLISLKTKTPAQLHENLMRGINAAVKAQILCECLPIEDRESYMALLDLMNALIPSQMQLEVIFT